MSGIYTNSTSAIERMEAALQYQIGEINYANGYDNRMGTVYLEQPQRKDITVWPACVLQRETAVSDAERSESPEYQSVRYVIPYTLLVLGDETELSLTTPEARQAWRNSILADVTARLMRNSDLTDSTGAETASNVWMGGNFPFKKLDNEPYVGQAIRFFVRVGHDLQDPSISTF